MTVWAVFTFDTTGGEEFVSVHETEEGAQDRVECFKEGHAWKREFSVEK